MKDRRIKLSVGRTIQPEQFNSIKIEFTYEGTIDDNADMEEEIQTMYENVAVTVDNLEQAELEAWKER